MPQKPHGKMEKEKAFSLIELLVVVSIAVLMMSLLLPAISGMNSTAGRRGAVNILMNTFEQARVAALESGQNVYVGFADADFPVEDMRYAAFIVFRDATEEEQAQNSNRKYVVLKKWTKLPKNVAFKTQFPGSIKTLVSDPQTFNELENELSAQFRTEKSFPVIKFTSAGTIAGSGKPPPLFLYDGYYSGNQDNFVRDANNLFEKISFSRYTGRAQLDVTALQ